MRRIHKGQRKSRCAIDAAAIRLDNIKFRARKRLRVHSLWMSREPLIMFLG